MNQLYDMSDIPNDLVLNIVWKNLPVNDIIILCQSSKFMANICKDNKTWRYLIQRDFGKNYDGEDAYEKYIILDKNMKKIQHEYQKFLYELNFEPTKSIDNYQIRHLRWISNLLLIENRSRMTKEQLYEAIKINLQERYPELFY